MNEYRDYIESNREYWDELAGIHPGTDFYDVKAFLEGESTLRPIELEELGQVSGRSLLHLQCHFGLDTLSWAREGARVTGVDFSERAIETARELRDKTSIGSDRARFIQSDIYELPGAHDGEYDIVFTSYGVLYWLPDIKRWAEVVDHFLKPNGTFYIVEIHPFTGTLSELDPSGEADFEYPYFHSDKPLRVEEQGTYADFDADVNSVTRFEWSHSMSEIINALISAGLQLEFVHEFPFASFKQVPSMEKGVDGWWRIPGLEVDLPFLFSIRAKKPN